MSASPAAVKSYVPAAIRAQVDKANQLVESLRVGDEPAAPEPEPAAPEPEPQPVDAAEHKYRVLQGKYNAEVPRLQRQVQEQEQLLRDMRQQLTNAQTMLASLNPGQPASNAAPPAQPAQRRVKDDEIRQFGPDLYDFIKRTSLEAVEPELTRMVRPVEQRLAKTEQAATSAASAVAQDAVQKLYDTLNTQVPEWMDLNEHPEFLEWLEQRDPYAGKSRGELLSQAYQAHDGPRVVAFFKGFKNENAAVTAQPSAPAEVPTSPEVQMLQLVAPGTPKAGPASGAPNDAGKRVWTRDDVQALYAKINQFTKKNKPVPQELRVLEADLVRAQSEGRIRI